MMTATFSVSGLVYSAAGLPLQRELKFGESMYQPQATPTWPAVVPSATIPSMTSVMVFFVDVSGLMLCPGHGLSKSTDVDLTSFVAG